jgi:sugar phosphate permease
MVWGLLMGVGLAFGCDIPTDKAIVNWFVNKRGSALGIKFTIEALSGVVILPIIAWLLTNQGWRLTSVIAGLAIAIVGFSLTFLFIKDHRAEFYGLLPDGAIRKEEAEKPKNTLNQSLSHPDKSGEVEYTLKQTMKTSPYWLIVSVGCLSGLATPMMRVHCVPFLTDIGYSPVEAAAMMGILISSSIPARFAIGFIIDRMKTNHLRFILVGGYLLQALGIFAFLSHKTTAMIYVWFILTGLGQGISFGVTLPMIARYYGRKAYGSIDGIRMMMITPTALVAPVYCGWVYDTTNSYMSLFGLFAGLLVISGIIAIFILPPKSTVQLTNFHTN